MNGYIKIRVMADGRYFDCWQKVVDGVVTQHVMDNGNPIVAPEKREEMVLDGRLHFAPNVLEAPEPPKPEPVVAEPTDTPEAPTTELE